MTVNLSLFAGAGAQFFDNNGLPLAGGLIYSYAAGTTTPQTTYTTNTGMISNSNPIMLDSAGRTPHEIWLTEGQSYKFILKTSDGSTLGTYDNIDGANDYSAILALLANTSNVAQGDALIGFKQSQTSGVYNGAVGQTVHRKLQEVVSAFDFMTPTQISDVQAGTLNEDVTSALQAWLTAVGTGNLETTILGSRAGFLPPGKYKVTSTLLITNNTTIYGVPWNSTLRPTSDVGNNEPVLDVRAGVLMRGIVIDGQDAIGVNGIECSANDVNLSNHCTFESCWFGNLAENPGSGNAGGIGVFLKLVVGTTFRDCWFYGSFRGVFSRFQPNPVTPTLTTFDRCTFRENDIGCYIISGHQMVYRGCGFESNKNEGFYCNNSGVSDAITNIHLYECWFENNWVSLAGDPSRGTKFEIDLIGISYFTMRDNILSQTGGNGPKNIQMVGVVNYLLDNNDWNWLVSNCIKIGNSCTGTIENWPTSPNNRNINNYVDRSGLGIYPQFGVDEFYGAYTPEFAFYDLGDLSVTYATQRAYYFKQGRLLTLFIEMVCTPTWTTAANQLRIENLGTGCSSSDIVEFHGIMEFSNITKAGYTQFIPYIEDGTNYIQVRASGSGVSPSLVTAANMTSGVSTTIKIQITYEVPYNKV